jgi:serine/threonine protein kinase
MWVVADKMSLPPALESEFELVEELPAGKVFHLYNVKDMRKGWSDAVVRLLPDKFAADQSIVNRFHEFFARFNDIPNRRYIPSVYSVVGVAGKDVYVVEEYCPGISLAQFVEKNRGSKTFIQDVTEVLARVCEGLHHAHQKTISHLCVLPSDILIDDHDYSKVKLVGFGAQIFAEKGKIDYLSSESRTYIAPEVFKRGVFSPKADVYSLAVTIKELLPEFHQGSDLLDKALSNTLKDRFPSARQFAASLQELALTGPAAESTPKASKPAKAAKPKGGLQPILKVTTDPPGTTLKVDGQVLGTTTISGFSFPWSPGKTITFEKPGYETETLSLDTPPENSTIQIKLKSALRLFTSPWGATVKVDGALLGTTTHKGLMIPWDKGEIVIEKLGFKSEMLRFKTAPSGHETCVEMEPQIAAFLDPILQECAANSSVLKEQPRPTPKQPSYRTPTLPKAPESQPRIWSTFRLSEPLEYYFPFLLVSVLIMIVGVWALLPHLSLSSVFSVLAIGALASILVGLLDPSGLGVKRICQAYEMALISAAASGDHYSVRILLMQGADSNATDPSGYTALMVASINGHYSVVKSLLESGADVNRKSHAGSTALDLAKQYNHPNVVELLANH